MKRRDGSFVAGVPLGGVVPRTLKDDPGLVMLDAASGVIAERYRRLAIKLERALAGRPAHSVVVTSAVAAEGKTVTALNLALAMAEERERKTLLVDLDLRRPRLSRFVTPPPKLGVGEVLSGKAPLEHALIHLRDFGLSVLPAGGPIQNPLEILNTDSARRLIDELRGRFDRIVIDTPPVAPFSDAAVVGAAADGAIVVVRAGVTAKAMIDRAFQSLDGAHLLGVVLNDVKITAVDRYYYAYDDYDPERYAAELKKKKTR